MAADPDPPVPARRYHDDEVALILSRASARDAGGLSAPHDPTLDDLMAAAREVGLDPAEVRRAAALSPPTGSALTRTLLGAPDARRVTAHLPGARVPADRKTLARRLEAAAGVGGRLEKTGPGRFAWRSGGAGSRWSVDLTEGTGGVELTVTGHRGAAYLGLLLMGLLTWAGLSAFTPLGALPALAKLVGLMVTPPLLARPFWAASDGKAVARLEGLAMEALRAAEEASPSSLSPGDSSPDDPGPNPLLEDGGTA